MAPNRVTGRTGPIINPQTAGAIVNDINGRNVAVSLDNLSGIVGGKIGRGGWIPLVDGSEPPVFVTDALGHLILVWAE